jgi:hypothetical protein
VELTDEVDKEEVFLFLVIAWPPALEFAAFDPDLPAKVGLFAKIVNFPELVVLPVRAIVVSSIELPSRPFPAMSVSVTCFWLRAGAAFAALAEPASPSYEELAIWKLITCGMIYAA